MVWCWILYFRIWEGCMTDVLDLEGLSLVTELAVELWMVKLFGGRTLKPAALLVALVAAQLETDEAVVQAGAHEMFMDEDPDTAHLYCEWLDSRKLDRGTYAMSLVMSSTSVDGLFLALSVAWANVHLGVLHADGLWSMQVNGSRSPADLLIVLTGAGF